MRSARVIVVPPGDPPMGKVSQVLVYHRSHHSHPAGDLAVEQLPFQQLRHSSTISSKPDPESSWASTILPSGSSLAGW